MARVLWVAIAVAGCAWPQSGGLEFYETSVRPILRANCIACHSDRNPSSGLSLESREAILRGGNRGPAVHLENAPESLLVQAVRKQGALKMPPAGALSPEQVAVLEAWIAKGVPAPAATAGRERPRPKHWAFQPPIQAPPPEVSNVEHPIDRFVFDRLGKAGLKPSPEADRRSLLRRVHLDLTGLPPTPAEVESFLADRGSDAYARVVDKLLASPQYGERWARHWLDLARYADSDGYTIDAPRDIWKYRDWVIQAINRDVPFDRFAIEQIAGDLLPNPTEDQLIATGFHRNTPSNFEGGIDFEQYRVEAVADRVATTGAAFLGLTLGCARCHDHKYDPISQREYYQLFAFLNSVDEVDKEADRKYFNKPFLEIGTDAEKAVFAEWEKEVYSIEAAIRLREDRVSGSGDDDPELKALREKLNKHRRARPKLVRTMIMRELPQPRVSYVHLGGDFTRRGIEVKPGVPAALPPLETENANPNRLDLARWLVSRKNPLTARVTVNRYWQHFFGKGLVETEDDFGTQGEKPSHPELLDWLAVEFMERGWSVKTIHRLIVTSATYKQASDARPDAVAVDPRNRLLARQNRLRLEAEAIRDSSLVASGLLTPAVGGPSVYPPIAPGANNVTQVKREWPTSEGPDRYRRAMYTFFQRSAAHPALLIFDAPDATAACTRRVRSNTPLQALITLNDQAYIEFAEALAKRVAGSGPDADEDKILYAWLLALGRPATSEETARVKRFVRVRRDSADDEAGVWTAVARALLNTDEFVTRP
jgi:mono/diheme cytochrome c family protein